MMETTIVDFLITIAPMALLVGAWFVFMWMSKKDGGLADLERRKVEALERIATALERRP